MVINTKGLETNVRGLLKADEKGNTTREGVFASGDVVLGARTVVEAVAHSKVVAESIENYIKNKNNN
ncbi:MAG: FAD-dependent oxidoreductase [Clostridium sp.]